MKAMRYFVIPVSAVLLPAAVYATNGMNLEGYGPEALGMGGASMAYDNGAAATMNNPATIGLMPEGHRADFALGLLGPDVSAKAGASNANSSGTAYYMPALGWLTKSGDFAYGVGLFSQGGMGTEYKANSFMAAGSGEKVRSELGVGRLIFPVAFSPTPSVTIGGSADFVWAGMDLKMAMTGAQFGDMVAALGGSQAAGTAQGTMVDGLVSMMPSAGFGGPPSGTCDPTTSTCLTNVDFARFDFSDSSPYTGDAMGTGFGAKIGAVFKPNPQATFGVTYHTKTKLSDLKATDGKVSMQVDFGGVTTATDQLIPVSGTIKVKDFQWPAMLGIGGAFTPADGLMLVADIKRIMWSDVMKDFTMEFTPDTTQANPMASGFAGSKMEASLLQKWDDQTVIALGGAYKVNNDVTVRLGYNHASNQIPNKYLNALFPAIEETHVTAGVGYAMSKAASIDFALSKGLDTDATNSQNTVKSTMSQLNWQVAFGYRY